MELIQSHKANLIFGGQWGSEGKGKLAGYLYHRYPEISVVISDFTPNAGHTFVNNAGEKFVSKALPTGILFDSIKHVIIGPHAVIDPERFNKELEECLRFRCNGLSVHIHPLTSILTSKDIESEVCSLNRIASTMQGSAATYISKIMRNEEKCHLAKDFVPFRNMITDTHELTQRLLNEGRTVLIETSQGFDLGLNHGYAWPYVTGRDCMLGRWLDNAGVHPRQLGLVTVALRTHPIRVGNTPGGNSGPHYTDQVEMSWPELSAILGRHIIEYTTVTKRVRRLFTASDSQIKRMCRLMKPDYAFLNFVNYIHPKLYNSVIQHFKELLANEGCILALLGNGPNLNEIVEV